MGLVTEHKVPVPPLWLEDFEEIAEKKAEEVARTLDRRGVPIPESWWERVEKEAKHQANNAVSAPVTSLSRLESDVKALTRAQAQTSRDMGAIQSSQERLAAAVGAMAKAFEQSSKDAREQNAEIMRILLERRKTRRQHEDEEGE